MSKFGGIELRGEEVGYSSVMLSIRDADSAFKVLESHDIGDTVSLSVTTFANPEKKYVSGPIWVCLILQRIDAIMNSLGGARWSRCTDAGEFLEMLFERIPPATIEALWRLGGRAALNKDVLRSLDMLRKDDPR